MEGLLHGLNHKIQDLEAASNTAQNWREAGERLVFTNGCFDLLHYGHIRYLAQAAELGDRLIIGLNSTASVRRLKGEHRPINDDLTRSWQLAAMQAVDLVIFFEEDTPLLLIEALRPAVLVKGGDYAPENIVGSREILSWGGEVRVLPFVAGYSTTNIEEKIRRRP